MADLPNRDELERQLARKLGGLQRAQLGRLLEALGDPPKIDNVPSSFWDEVGRELAGIIAPFLEDIYLQQAKRLMEKNPVGVDWALVNEKAIEWASRYTFDLVRNINTVSRRAIQKAVSAYFERGQTIGDLEKALSGLFGPVRAEMIAVTEITRAASQGEMSFVDDLKAMGIEMIVKWATNRDELVCPICAPRNGKKQGDGWDAPPPAHPRCRCWLNSELPKVNRG